MKAILCTLALVCAIPAQVVTASNNSSAGIKVWRHIAVDVRPPHASGKLGTCRYVLGQQLAPDLWSLDLWLELGPNEQRTLDLAQSTAAPFTLGPLPADILGHFGGWAACDGIPMGVEALAIDGAAYTATLRARTGPLLDARLYVRWYPETPALMYGEAVVTASNPGVPDMVQTSGGVRLTWGDAIWHVTGRGALEPIVPAGIRLADGQAWSTPVVFGWIRHAVVNDFERWSAACSLTVSATQSSALYFGGNPRLPAGFDGVAWSVQNHPRALAALHSWSQPPAGPNRLSGDTGAQEDQWCVGSEALASPGAVWVRYLSALALSHRPCHHLSQDGRQVDKIDFPKVMFWEGRPHPATGNLFGKPRTMTADETSGWWGPDDEHWLYNSLFAAYRLTGSAALQREIETQARLYLFQKTVPSQNPGWFTSGGGVARAIGWECLLAVHLHRNLRDRALAERVADRWRARWRECWRPTLGLESARLGWWDVRRDDRLGPGIWAITWQCAVGAAFLDYAGEYFSDSEARERAMAEAAVIMERGWTLRDGRWKSWAQQPLPGEAPMPEPDESFNYFGLCLAPWVVLRHDLENGPAKALWQWLQNHASSKQAFAWLPPGDPVN